MKNALSFSLFGDGRRYLIGAVKNLDDASRLYPGWDVVIHVERGHPLIGRLRKKGAIIIEHDPEPGVGGALWRFETVNYADRYDRVCVRDIDSILIQREVDAVNDWIERDTLLHAMMDGNLRKNRRIQAGAFGVKTNHGLPYKEALEAWKPTGRYGNDEDFLNSKIWPMFEHSATCHTRQIRYPLEIPFPTPRPARGGVASTIRPGPIMRSQLPTYRIGPKSVCLPGEIGIEMVKAGHPMIGATLAHIRALTEIIRANTFPCIVLEGNAVWRSDAHDLPVVDAPWLWIGLSLMEQVIMPDGRPRSSRQSGGPKRSSCEQGVIEMGDMYCVHGVVYLNMEGALRMLDVGVLSLARSIPIDSGCIFMCNERGWKRPGLAIPWVYQAGKNRKYTDFSITSTPRTEEGAA